MCLIRTDSLLEPPSSGISKNCSFWGFFQCGFIFSDLEGAAWGCAPWIGLVLAHLSDARLDSDPENVEAE